MVHVHGWPTLNLVISQSFASLEVGTWNMASAFSLISPIFAVSFLLSTTKRLVKTCIEQILLCRLLDKKSKFLPCLPMGRIRGSNGTDVTTSESHAVALEQLDEACSDSIISKASSTRPAADCEARGRYV